MSVNANMQKYMDRILALEPHTLRGKVFYDS